MPAETLTRPRPAAPAAPESGAPPVEIRAARRAEVDQVLAVRSEAFGLAREAWPPPASATEEDLARIRVVVSGGRVLSCLNILAARIRIGAAKLAMGGICNVATLPEERNRGHASALMRDAVRAMGRLGLSTSILFPFSFRYYRKFGYELAGNHCQFWCRPHNLPPFGEHRHCRTAGPDDIPRIAALYAHVCQRRSCALERSEERWRDLVGGDQLRVTVYDPGEVTGYVVTRESVDHYGGGLLAVEELAALDAATRRGLLGCLSRYQGEAIEWCASPADLAESGVLRSVAPLREGFKPRGIATVRPMFQFRVVDLLAALKARATVYAGLAGELTLLVRDDLVPENNRPMAIAARDGTVQILAGQRTERFLETDIRAFSQIFCGYLTPAEAVSQGLARVSDAEALEVAETFFPALEPFLPQMDRF